MSKINFTAGRIEELQCEPGKAQTIHWDAKTPSLGLRVTSNGAKSFIFEATLHNKTIRTTIGRIESWRLSDARNEATRLRNLTDSGTDPRQLAKQNEQLAAAAKAEEKAKMLIITEAWDIYIKQNRFHWGQRHLNDLLNAASKGGQQRKRGGGVKVRGALYPILQKKFADISTTTLSNWIKSESASRANKARQAFEIFRTFWKWCARKPEYARLVDVTIVDDIDLRRLVPKRKAKRFDVLEKSQLQPWFEAVNGISSKVIKAYLQALLLTGARREEMAQLKWADIDTNAIWVKDKVDEAGRKIPLTPYLSYLIHGLPKREKNPWVFSSPTAASGHITEPRIAHNRALSSAGLSHVSLHGLRRSFASLAEWVEMPTGVAAQIMGHKPTATAEKHYINRPIDLLAIWHTKYEKWILEQAGIEFQEENPAQLRLVK